MQDRIDKLKEEVRELKAMVKGLQSSSAPTSNQATADGAVVTNVPAEQQNVVQAEDRKTLEFLRNTTINLGLDTYYPITSTHRLAA
jgi:hypothetical protein